MTCHLYLFKDIVFLAYKQKEKGFKILWAYLLAWFLILHHSYYYHLSSYWEASQPSSASRSREEKRRSRECFSTSTAACVYETTISTQKGTREDLLCQSQEIFLSLGSLFPLFFCYYIFMCLYPAKILHTLHPSFSTNFCWTLAFIETRFL